MRIVKTVLLIGIVTLSSCGVFKDVTKNKVSKKERIDVVEKGAIVSNESTVDKTKVVTEERVTEAGKSEEREKVIKTPLKDLQDGEEYISEDSLLRVSILLDSLNNIITTITKKEEIVITPKIITRTEYRDIVRTKRDTIVAVREERRTLDEKIKEVKKEPTNIFWFIIGGIAGLALVLYTLIRTLKR